MEFEFEKGLAEKLKKELENKIENEKDRYEITKIYSQFKTVFRDYFSSLEILNEEFNKVNDENSQDFSTIEQEFFNIEFIENELENKLSLIEDSIVEDRNIESMKFFLYEEIYNIEIYESSLETKLEEYEENKNN